MSSGLYVMDNPPGDAFGKQLVQVALEKLEDHGLHMGFPFRKRLDPQLMRYGWVDKQHRAVVTLVDDFRTPVRYLIVDAMTPQEVEQIGTWLAEYMDFISLADLERDAREQMHTQPSNLIRLASGAPETFTPSTYQIVQRGLQATDPAVQYAAAFAAGLLQWPEFAGDLEALLTQIGDDPVYTVATRALESCRRMVEPQP